MNSTRRTTFLLALSALVVASLLTASLQATVIVDDSWADGTRTNDGPLQAAWWSSSSTSGNSIEVYPNELGLISGTSGRGIHGTFAPQNLAVGDSIKVTYSFTTPATVSGNGTDNSTAFKVALMDLNDAGLAADLSSSGSSVNPLYTALPGYMADFDVFVRDTGPANVTVRKHQNPNTSGRFLGTTAEWDSLGGSTDDGYTWAANTPYVGSFIVTRTGADSANITASMSQGATLMGTTTQSDVSGIANHFGMFGLWTNSNTFGSTTTAGQAEDNGITLTNVKVEYCPIPEPASIALLVGAVIALPGMRRIA